MSKDWDWHGKEEQESIVIHPVDAVAVYTNPKGNVVIRQTSDLMEEDAIIIIPEESVHVLIKALERELEISKD